MMTSFITGIRYDRGTNLPIVTDNLGNQHIISWENINKDISSERHYLQSWVKNYTWGSTTAFNRIPDAQVPGKFLSYKVPDTKCFNISFVMLAQSKDDKVGVSYVGLYVAGNLKATVPFKNEMHYVLFSPIYMPPGTELEFKYMPFDKKCEFGITVGGPLIDCT